MHHICLNNRKKTKEKGAKEGKSLDLTNRRPKIKQIRIVKVPHQGGKSQVQP